MPLPTSNLSVITILQTFGVSNPRSIFYNGDGSLKTVAQLGAMVNKNGLNPTYCPGATADERLANLQAQRNLKYFKGYVPVYLTCNPETFSFTFNGGSGDIYITCNSDWTVSDSISWVTVSRTTGSGNGSFTIIVDSNGLTQTRRAIITVQSGEVLVTITVDQDAWNYT